MDSDIHKQMETDLDQVDDLDFAKTLLNFAWQAIRVLEANYAKLQEAFECQQQKIVNRDETIAELQRMIFGKSSEKTRHGESLPDEDQKKTELSDGEDSPEGKSDHQAPDTNQPEKKPDQQESDGEDIHVRGYTRKNRKPKATREELYESLPVRKVCIPVPDDQRNCPYCNTPMETVSWKFVREELRITPAKVERIQYMQEVLACPTCRKDGALQVCCRTVWLLPVWSLTSCVRKPQLRYLSTDRRISGGSWGHQLQGKPRQIGVSSALSGISCRYMADCIYIW